MSANGTEIRSGNLPDQERKDDGLDPETGNEGGGRERGARKGRLRRRVREESVSNQCQLELRVVSVYIGIFVSSAHSVGFVLDYVSLHLPFFSSSLTEKADEPPAKLLDDLFLKTKAAPCIYWLPLTEEQVCLH